MDMQKDHQFNRLDLPHYYAETLTANEEEYLFPNLFDADTQSMSAYEIIPRGLRFRHIAEKQGLTNAAQILDFLAEGGLQVSHPTVARWLVDPAGPPDKYVAEISKIFNVDPIYLTLAPCSLAEGLDSVNAPDETRAYVMFLLACSEDVVKLLTGRTEKTSADETPETKDIEHFDFRETIDAEDIPFRTALHERNDRLNSNSRDANILTVLGSAVNRSGLEMSPLLWVTKSLFMSVDVDNPTKAIAYLIDHGYTGSKRAVRCMWNGELANSWYDVAHAIAQIFNVDETYFTCTMKSIIEVMRYFNVDNVDDAMFELVKKFGPTVARRWKFAFPQYTELVERAIQLTKNE